ncbi:MAG: ATP-dependent RNA helicase HrpA [Deltaproteobacteria bacterium]|nr:ATP-dependent RNA helicase HrpA [Deltaproteobacteria bacterium]
MLPSEIFKKRIAARMRELPRSIYPLALPILDRKEEIIEAIRNHPVVIVTGETGSGKTTQLPKLCLEAGRGLTGLIACTQPRRIAATTVAMRIAEELGEEIGQSVGYKIRFDERTRREAYIKVMTDGILLMETQRDPLLRAYDTVIVDEAHERSLNIDFILGILKTILPRRRDLRVIITSATIDTEKFSKAFNDAPIIEVSGRLYPVELRYRPIDPQLEETGELTHVEAAVRAVDELVERREGGDILIFMPTEQDIRETCALLTGRFREAAILPLFSRLTTGEQQRVFSSLSVRKIVVATNVAETSITIPGIRYVIDTGLARISQYNPRSRTAGLPVRAISRSSADQRKGRCGRVQNGICIRLYSEEDYLGRPLYTPPEIVRANLAGVILRMLSLHLGDIEAFPFIDSPSAKSIRDGLDILLELGAIEPGEKHVRGTTPPWRLTERGRHMSRLPLDPRISRMILEAKQEGCLKEIVVIAAALSIQDPRERPAEKEAQADLAHKPFRDPASDFSGFLGLWRHCYGPDRSVKTQSGLRRFCRDHFLSYRRIREWKDIHDQIHQILSEQKLSAGHEASSAKEGGEFYAALHRSILSGFLGHIALKKEKNLYTATQGRQAMIFPGSGLFNRGGNWIVAAELVETSRLFARTVANIESAWLEELGGALCRRTYAAPHWEKDRGEVVASEQVTLFGLIIVSGRSVSFGRIDPEAAAKIFVRAALIEGEVKRPLPFLTCNQRLIDSIAALEDKLRRRDLLTDEETLARFYEKRLPGIFDIRTLQRLIRDRGGDDFLRMHAEDLLVKEPDADEIALFPEAVSAGGWNLGCIYRFEPGKPEDGVTLKIPVHAIPSVPAASLDWAVPGLLREKVSALLKGLPKEYRKQLMPLAQTAEIILREMEREGFLLTSLGRFIYRRFGVDIPADRWPSEGMENHLKLRYAVVDEKDRELAAGRDIGILKQEFVAEGESQAFAEARKTWEKTGLTAWDFGDLPKRITLLGKAPHAPVAFPALAETDSGIAIRLFRSEADADLSHIRGVKALLSLRFRDELKHLRKGITPSGDLKIWAAAFGGVKILESAVLEKIGHDLFVKDIRNAAEFSSHADRVRPLILPRGQEVLKLLQPLLKALYEATEQLRALETANRSNRPLLAFLATLREEITDLIPADFLIRYETERIGHISRYLRALTIRAERGAVHLEKALERGKEIRELTAWRQEMLLGLPPYASAEKRQALEEFRWLIEEYKISLFAQEIKTAGPISRKRIDARIGDIQRMQ